MAADTACTMTLGNATTPLDNEVATPNGIHITAANNHTMRGTSRGNLPLALPATATECHRVPNLHSPLLSVGQACDADCTAIFDATKMMIVKSKHVDITLTGPPITAGVRTSPGLWMVPLKTQCTTRTFVADNDFSPHPVPRPLYSELRPA